jgi:hypothetical protein
MKCPALIRDPRIPLLAESRKPKAEPRPGFTITELLVSMALIMLIMGVMAEAFTESLRTFAAMKAIGDMDQKMRAAIVILARDLSDDHFGFSPTPYLATANSGAPFRLSNIPLNTAVTSTATTGPTAGFFAFNQSSGSASEGNDADGNPSYVNTTGLLHFTVNRAKSWDNNVNIHHGRRENYFSANSTALTSLSRFSDSQNYYSQVAEVAYFLRDSGDTTPNGTKRYTLFRRQAAVLTDSDATAQAATSANATNFCDFSWGPAGSPNANKFNKFGDLTVVANRRLLPSGSYSTNAAGCAGPIPIYAEENTSFSGNDILLTDVLSFDIQVMRSDGNPYTFTDVSSYDTSTAQSFNIKAIQIIIRVWDIKTQSARQITIVQDM